MPGTEVTFDTVRNGVWLLHVSPAVKFSRQPQTIIPREASKLQQIDQFLRTRSPFSLAPAAKISLLHAIAAIEDA